MSVRLGFRGEGAGHVTGHQSIAGVWSVSPVSSKVPPSRHGGDGSAVKPRRILVPLDGRLASETALPTAIEFARESGGRLYLLRVLGTAERTAGASVRQRAAVRRAERYLAATRQRLATDGVSDVSTAVWSGSPAAAIVKAADSTEADLIIMATSGLTAPPRKLVGSVVERVLRGTKRPVLVVTPAEAVVDTSLGDAAPLPDPAATLRVRSSADTPRVPGSSAPLPGPSGQRRQGRRQPKETGI